MLALAWPAIGVILGFLNVGLLIWAELSSVRGFWPILVIILTIYSSFELATMVSLRAFRRLTLIHPNYMSGEAVQHDYWHLRYVLDQAAVDSVVRDARFMQLYRLADAVSSAVNFEFAVTVAGIVIWVFMY